MELKNLICLIFAELSTAQWLNHDFLFYLPSPKDTADSDRFRENTMNRLRTTAIIREALIFQPFSSTLSSSAPPDAEDRISVGLEINGINGELANLDLVNLVVISFKDQLFLPNFKFSQPSSFATSRTTSPISDLKSYKLLRILLDWISALIPVSKNVRAEIDLLIQEVISLSFSTPANPLHGILRSHMSVHTVTINMPRLVIPVKTPGAKPTTSSIHETTYTNRNIQMEQKLGMAIINVIRSLNNLIEGLHQSYFIYWMLSIRDFVGFEEAIPSFVLLLSSFLFQLVHYYLALSSTFEGPGEIKVSVNINDNGLVTTGSSRMTSPASLLLHLLIHSAILSFFGHLTISTMTYLQQPLFVMTSFLLIIFLYIFFLIGSRGGSLLLFSDADGRIHENLNSIVALILYVIIWLLILLFLNPSLFLLGSVYVFIILQFLDGKRTWKKILNVILLLMLSPLWLLFASLSSVQVQSSSPSLVNFFAIEYLFKEFLLSFSIPLWVYALSINV